MAGIAGYISNPQVPAITSGSVGSTSFASGNIQQGFLSFLMAAGETISGGLRPVCFLSGGISVGISYSNSGFRLPSVGVSASNYLSGNTVQVILFGSVQTPYCSGWSGFAGSDLMVGSGLVGTLSGMGIGLANFVGAAWQRVGTAYSGGLLISVQDDVAASGVVVGPGGILF